MTWGVLKESVFKTRIRDVNHLKERFIEEWASFDQKIIDESLGQKRKHLSACTSVDGGHFEPKI